LIYDNHSTHIGNKGVPVDLAKKIQRLEDRAELRELVDRYCLAIDDSDWDGLAHMFAEDAQMAGKTGRAEVVGVLRSIRSGYGRTIHTALAQTLDFTDEGARGVVTGRGELAIAGQTMVCAMRYLDDYVKTDGRWRFARRDVRFSYALPQDQLATAMTADQPVAWPGAKPQPADEMSPA
jgi:hypothetical protein